MKTLSLLVAACVMSTAPPAAASLVLAPIPSVSAKTTGLFTTWVVETTGLYQFVAVGGAGGGTFRGAGAVVVADYQLTAGTTLSYLVGGAGNQSNNGLFGNFSGGGGGGTFVMLSALNPLIVAAGGGGGSVDPTGGAAVPVTFSTAGRSQLGAPGGSNGYDGSYSNYGAAGGIGYRNISQSLSPTVTPPPPPPPPPPPQPAPPPRVYGGNCSICAFLDPYINIPGKGGIGGGADALFLVGGGGGGYSGGGGGNILGYGGGGGGSFSGIGTDATFSVADPGQRNGMLTITALTDVPGAVPEPATWTTMIVGFGLIGSILRRRRLRIVVS